MAPFTAPHGAVRPSDPYFWLRLHRPYVLECHFTCAPGAGNTSHGYLRLHPAFHLALPIGLHPPVPPDTELFPPRI